MLREEGCSNERKWKKGRTSSFDQHQLVVFFNSLFTHEREGGKAEESMNAGGEGGREEKKIKEKVKQEKDAPSDAETLVCAPIPAQICPKAK